MEECGRHGLCLHVRSIVRVRWIRHCSSWSQSVTLLFEKHLSYTFTMMKPTPNIDRIHCNSAHSNIILNIITLNRPTFLIFIYFFGWDNSTVKYFRCFLHFFSPPSWFSILQSTKQILLALMFGVFHRFDIQSKLYNISMCFFYKAKLTTAACLWVAYHSWPGYMLWIQRRCGCMCKSTFVVKVMVLLYDRELLRAHVIPFFSLCCLFVHTVPSMLTFQC